MVYLSPADEGYIDCIVCNVHTLLPAKLVCRIRIQYRHSTKNEDVNWVRINPRTVKYHSLEMGDTLRGSTAILQLAAWKLYGIREDLFAEFVVFRKVSGDMYCKCKNITIEAIFSPLLHKATLRV